ncbi:MAG: iron-containing alcohol dehydrogenase [Ruminococcaceae bacterium]|nr:iron-containing alcohol dehydrogenase [Oscillospiraceae bacterium]
MKEFSCETKIVMGRGALEALKQFSFQRLMVVSDPFFAKNGWAERVGKYSQSFAVFHKIVPDPTVTLVAEGTAELQKFQPDGIVAIGGGSAMDCAKAMTYFSGLDIPLVAVPTTSGSGSEVTDFAILTHDGVKHPLVDKKLRPCLAILEEELLTGLPNTLIADGGFDVISHALEAWVGSNANPFTDALALEAFCAAFQFLPRSFEGDTKVRLSVHTASCMAGLSFTQAGLGLCHAISHSLGGQFHIPHGRLNAILLPAVISYNAEAVGSRYAELSRRIGLGGISDAMALRNLKNALVRLRNQLRLPATLAEAGVSPGLLQEKMQSLISAACQDPCCKTNPLPVTAELVRQVLSEVAGRG